MTNPIERNDIDLNRLLTWRKEFSIIDMQGDPFTVYIRLVGDAEVNRSRVYAIRKSNEYRKLLRDPNSDEYLTYIPIKDELTKETIVEGIIAYSMREFSEQARADAKLPEPKELKGDATLEEQEQYQAEIDSYPERQKKHLESFVEKMIDKKRKELNKLEIDSLYATLVKLLVDFLCENKMLEAFRDMTTYFGTYSDPGYRGRLMGTIDDFNNLPTSIKTQLISAYNTLELGIDDLKN